MSIFFSTFARYFKNIARNLYYYAKYSLYYQPNCWYVWQA